MRKCCFSDILFLYCFLKKTYIYISTGFQRVTKPQYRLAEQIIQTRKKIHAPSYYGIFKEKDIEFVDVKIDGRYEREDKQPDVIATTKDNQQYIIELTFDYKVQHKQALDYKNLNCLEINLSNQTLESVEKFLLEENTDRIWFNNQEYFDSIEPRYEMANKRIEVKNEDECKMCELYNSCVGVRAKESGSILVIENSGKRYRICKPEQYDVAVEDKRNSLSERTCFMCKRNLTWWKSNDGMAHCGAYYSMEVPQKTPPDSAQTCNGFEPK